MITVFGRLLASFFDAQAAPVPVTGRVLFTPNFSSEHTAEGVHLPTRLSVELDDEGRFEASLLTGSWSWRVEVIAKDEARRTLTLPCFNFLPEEGVDRVNFAEIVPLADPVTGEPMLRGEDGIGVEAITTAGGELIFTLTDGSETRIPVPQGIPGTSIEGITLQGDELVFALSDGSETRLPAPEGTPGDEGVGISGITLVDGELVFTLTNGAETRLPAPKGEPGTPGVSPPAPTLSVGNVATLPNGSPASASITGTTPNYTLALGIPQGAQGVKGDSITGPAGPAGPKGDSVTGPAGPKGDKGDSIVGPAGPKGETGNPSTMTLVGAGRPDTPATLSTANQTAVANAPVGATFTSTDGAGVGAWAWVKTQTGWAVTYGDTGWRDVTTWLVDPAGADKTALPPSPVSRGRLLARRTTAGVELTSTTAIDFTTDVALQIPEGWWDSRALAVSIKWDSTERKPLIPTLPYSRTLYNGGATPWATRAGRYLIEGRWGMTGLWPATQPGTPS